MKKIALVTLCSITLLVSAPRVSFADETTGNFDSTVLAQEVVDPTSPTTPVEPIDPTTPVDSVDPTDPVDPVNPTEPTEPTDPTEPEVPTTPTVTDNPTEQAVTTDAGHVIVAVEASKPIIQLADGTTQKVEAKEIGATVQNDGTISVKGNDGKMKVLPKTGSTSNLALSVLGGLFVLGSGVALKKS